MTPDPYIYTICSYSGGIPVYNYGLANGQTTPTVCNALAIADWSPRSSQIYPNPTKDLVTVRFAEFQTNTSIKISNVLGQVISEEANIQALEKQIRLDGQSGIYWIEIENNGQKQTFKVIKQ